MPSQASAVWSRGPLPWRSTERILAFQIDDPHRSAILRQKPRGCKSNSVSAACEPVFYLHRRVPNSYEIRFHEFASGDARVVGDIEAGLFYGLTVSPDRKTFLFSKGSDEGSDLMLIENLR